MEEIDVCINLRSFHEKYYMFTLQKIKDQIYAHFGVSKDPATHQNLGGEDKLKLKGTYVCICKI